MKPCTEKEISPAILFRFEKNARDSEITESDGVLPCDGIPAHVAGRSSAPFPCIGDGWLSGGPPWHSITVRQDRRLNEKKWEWLSASHGEICLKNGQRGEDNHKLDNSGIRPEHAKRLRRTTESR